MVIGRLRGELRRSLGENGHEADWIISHVTGLSLSDIIMRPREVTDTELRAIEDIAARRNSGEPLQYILGCTEFMGLTFRVTADTLIPRQDTETLVEAAVAEIGDKALRVLDIGTGSGCVGISIAKLRPNTIVTLLDLSDAALEVARENAQKNGVDVRLVGCDILKEIPKGEYDIIVSNPPYIRTEDISRLDDTVKCYEPAAALDGGTDGLVFYRRIAGIAPRMLAGGGRIAFEIGYDQGAAVMDILRSADFTNVTVTRDSCGNDRVVTARMK